MSTTDITPSDSASGKNVQKPETAKAPAADVGLSTERYLPVIEAMIIGAAAGGSAIILLHGINWLGSLRMSMSDRYGSDLVLPAMGLIGGAVAGLLVHLAPEVSGSGIPQVRALLNRINLRLGFFSALVKLLGGIIALGCGLFMGREGPTVQVGAALAASLSRRLPTTAEHRRQLIAAGAGAGLAAAFNAPIAGVTFVIEELLKEARTSTISLALVACFSAAVVENIFSNAREHSVIKYMGRPMPVPVHLQDILFYILLGLMCAFFGAVFNSLIMGFLRMYRQSRLPVIIRTAFAGLVTGLVVASLPPVFHNYAQARAIINAGTVSPDMVPMAFVSFFFLVLLAYGSGAPGGLFAPSLVLGAALGYMVGFAHLQITGQNLIDVFTQVGMGAFFAAVARVPLTATVIVFEMSGNFGLIPPLMIASVIGSAAAERLSKGSLYDLLMVWSGINLQGPTLAEEAHALRVVDVMDNEVKPIQGTAAIKDAADLMRAGHEHGCPVLKGKRLSGIITASIVELAEKTNDTDKSVSSVMKQNAVSVSPYDSLDDILFLFSRYKYEWLPVSDDGVFIGTVSRHVVIDALFPLSDLDASPNSAEVDQQTQTVRAALLASQTDRVLSEEEPAPDGTTERKSTDQPQTKD